MALGLSVVALAAVFGWTSPVCGQSAPAPPSTAIAALPLPEPVHWRKNLFLIPYQWTSAADPGGAQAVWLFFSKDAGATWQKISEAKPHVRAFNYRAEQDGEYWFAIRTVDRDGRVWPAGPYRPELRVIVDTTMPRVDELVGLMRDDATLEIRWRAVDPNIDASSWKIEVQTDANGPWHLVPLPIVASMMPGVSAGQTTWISPDGRRPVALRAVVYDRAGNPAVFSAEIGRASATDVASDEWPTIISGRGDGWPPDANRLLASGVGPAIAPTIDSSSLSGWVTGPAAATAVDRPPAQESQPWPAARTARAPFRLFDGPGELAADAATTYGRPDGVGTPLAVASGEELARRSPGEAPLANARTQPVDADRDSRTTSPPRPQFTPLEPFRQASVKQAPATGEDPLARVDVSPQVPQWTDEIGRQPPAGIEPTLVAARTFALEYELEEVGRWGVSKVQLWGTRDGGQTWRHYATDDDNRSPLVVSVEGNGLYGFRIVVDSAAGMGSFAPQSGDEPELWVAVDLHRPRVELTAIEPGSGDLSDHLILRWVADDDNLQPRPISLFYSSRPAGPWSALATHLENTGEFAWRLERHVPSRFYLRLEAHDTAGNLAAYQTAEPVLLERPQPTGHIQAVRPLSATPLFSSPAAR